MDDPFNKPDAHRPDPWACFLGPCEKSDQGLVLRFETAWIDTPRSEVREI
jgi:hypothetical protein